MCEVPKIFKRLLLGDQVSCRWTRLFAKLLLLEVSSFGQLIFRVLLNANYLSGSLRAPRNTFQNDMLLTPTAPVNWICSTPSPVDAATTAFTYPSTSASTSGYTTASNNVRASLKSCRTTDIDHALSVVVESSPAIFSLRYNDGIQETHSISANGSTSYFEATVLPAPSSPVSEPPSCLEDVSDDGDWIKNLLESSFAAIDDSCHEDMDMTLGSSSTKERKAFSAPNSLRRPGEKKPENVTVVTTMDNEEIEAVAEKKPVLNIKPATAVPRSPTSRSVTFSPEVKNGDCLEDDVSQEMMFSKEPAPPMLTKQLSESEEKLLLAELRKTPPENSPSHDDLRNLFPELNKIYSSLEELPTIVSTIDNGADDERYEERAPSITDLEVIETNPEWRSPDGSETGNVAEKRDEEKLEIDPNLQAENGVSRMQNEIFRGKVLKDAATSPVLKETVKTPSPVTSKLASTSMETDIRGLLANVDTAAPEPDPVIQEPAVDHFPRPIKSDESSAKFISFEEANAVFDRRETLQAVQSSRYDSEDEDSIFLDSIYDNVESSPTKSLAIVDSKQAKPTPKPRVSKLKTSFNGTSTSSAPYLDARVFENEKPTESAVVVHKTTARPQRPVILTVTPGDPQKNWSSSEESELANSPLFRKQQQHLFLLAPSSQDGERNKSEPPCAESVNTRLSHSEGVERRMEPSSAKSESHLYRAASSAEDKKTLHHVIAPSPRSAFSPVPPKINVICGSATRIPSGNAASASKAETVPKVESSNPPQLHSILSSSTKKSPSMKSKNAHVYFV